MNDIIIAIDPGKAGSIAVKFTDNQKLYVDKMPENNYDIYNYFNELREATKVYKDCNIICLMEQVRPMHNPKGAKKGVKQTWGQASNHTALMISLYAANISVTEVTPAKWMQKLPGTRPKEYNDRKRWLKEHAQRLYPQEKVTLWNADALCLLHVSGEFI